jgi:hypothetical protein
MDDSWTGFSADPLEVWAVMQYCINQSSCGSAGRRVNHYSRTFVDNDAVIILVDNVQGNRLSHQDRLFRRQGLDGDEIVGFQSRAGFRGFAV